MNGITVSFACFHGRILCENSKTLKVLRETFSPFLSPHKKHVDFTVEISGSAPLIHDENDGTGTVFLQKRKRTLCLLSPNTPLLAARDEGAVKITSAELTPCKEASQIPRSMLRGRLHFIHEFHGKQHQTGRFLSDTHAVLDAEQCIFYEVVLSALREMAHYRLSKKGGFLLHSSCGSINGNGFVFTGKSGAGKSTALKQLKCEKIITDHDLAVVPDGAYYTGFSLPFQNEKPNHAQISHILFPKKSKCESIKTKGSLPDAFLTLFENAYFFSKEEDFIGIIMKNVLKCSQKVPCADMYFKKNTNVKKLLLSFLKESTRKR